jgi:ABC-type sugar transport system ATPase subunit
MANKMTSRMKLKFRDLDQSANELSGGNQQKVVLSKWLASNPKILILDEPTRGIDVNAKKQIYDMIFDLKKTNIGITLVSSELIELLGMSDRIYVMREGKMMKQIVNENITDETIMSYMMGGVANGY